MAKLPVSQEIFRLKTRTQNTQNANSIINDGEVNCGREGRNHETQRARSQGPEYFQL